MKTLILVRGLPGSGKSTFANIFQVLDPTVPIFEADDYFYDESGVYNFDLNKLGDAHETCQNNVREAMESDHRLIVVSNTFTRNWETDDYKQLAVDFGYKLHYIVVENRHNGKSTHDVPEITLLRMRERFQIWL